MKFFQFLYILSSNIPLIVFNLNGEEICRVLSKEMLNSNLYDYDILEISGIGQIDFYREKLPTLIITLVK